MSKKRSKQSSAPTPSSPVASGSQPALDPEPNIAFVGDRSGHRPLLLINNGDVTIVLPEDQSRPFHHAEASTICRLYGWLYKAVKQP